MGSKSPEPKGMKKPTAPKRPEPEVEDPKYEAHLQLLPRAAMLQKDAEHAEGEIRKLQGEIEDHLQENVEAQTKAEKDGDPKALNLLQEDEKKLRAAYDSLEEGIGRMTFG